MKYSACKSSSTLVTLVYILYNLLWILLLPLVIIRLFYKSLADFNYRKRLSERCSCFVYKSSKDSIWIHAVSVGEVIAAKELVNRLYKQDPTTTIIVTTMTPSGSAQVQKLLANKVFHVYLPYDIHFFMRNFFIKIRPKKIIIIETEVWPSMLWIAKQYQVPVILANARMSTKSLRGYYKFNWITSWLFSHLIILAIAKADAVRFKLLGANMEQTFITGSIKYDLQIPSDLLAKQQQLLALLPAQRLIIAGSTHANEEQMILASYCKLDYTNLQTKLIIFPRHPHRASAIVELASKYGLQAVLRSDLLAIPEHDYDVIIGDTIGELLYFYSIATVIFIGGSLIEHGGHNPIEGAIFGKALLIGEYVYNFADIYQQLISNKGCKIVHQNDLSVHLIELLTNEHLLSEMGQNAYFVVDSLRGSIDRQLAIINKFL